METFENTWEIKGDSPAVDFAFAVTKEIADMARKQLPEFAEMFPFRRQWEANATFSNGCTAILLRETTGNGVPSIGEIKETDLLNKIQEFSRGKEHPSFEEIYSFFGSYYFNFDQFLYIGKYDNSKLSWRHILTVLVEWINRIVVPVVLKNNEKRVLSAIPIPPQFEVGKLTPNVFVLESEKHSRQGTCFHLAGIGLVTCEHAFCEEMSVFRSSSINNKVKTHLVKSNATIDLAILKADGFELGTGLEIGSSDNLKIMDHIASIGFPNYRYGDTGVFSPGLVVGFRPVSGIRRILVNTPLISGNSGGPVVDRFGKVIGVVVTGADRMENANGTENHGVIPIEALKLL
ncbi:MAG: serine protease [Fibrobacteres bacterium]|nr:serine protease [Fibrobacterota bacterium]